MPRTKTSCIPRTPGRRNKNGVLLDDFALEGRYVVRSLRKKEGKKIWFSDTFPDNFIPPPFSPPHMGHDPNDDDCS
ncbi:hypothetical protein NPIL_583441 [Nephila pilipes]|uniref:Uncharacterized protein n=1 Tax=Nephila pilipes TaxID=299642 RepID=A0A8X6Q9J6_NEPPI|nr:hypothetical protein NPIL_583441 [Nephila pilipes]